MVSQFDIRFFVTILGSWFLLFIVANALNGPGKSPNRCATKGCVATSSESVWMNMCTLPEDPPSNAVADASSTCHGKEELSPGEECTWTGVSDYTCTNAVCSAESVLSESSCAPELCDDSTPCNPPNGTASGTKPDCECSCAEGFGGDACDGFLIKTMGLTSGSAADPNIENRYFELKNADLYTTHFCRTAADHSGLGSGSTSDYTERPCHGIQTDFTHWRNDGTNWVEQDHGTSKLKWLYHVGKSHAFRLTPTENAFKEGDMIKFTHP